MAKMYETPKATRKEPPSNFTNCNDDVHPTSIQKNRPLSVYMTVVLVFATHGFVNTVLLSGWSWSGSWSHARCLYWNLHECSKPQYEWMLNWFSLYQFHVCTLITALAITARGNFVLEQRLVHLVGAIMVSHLSSGIFILPHLNQPMALVQVLLYGGLLAATLIHASLSASNDPLQQHYHNHLFHQSPLSLAQLRSSSYDPRQKISATTLVVLSLASLSSIQIWDLTFGKGSRQGYFYYYDADKDVEDGDKDVIWESMSQAAVAQRLWTVFVLFWSAALATVQQHKALLTAHAVCLFVALCLLTGSPGQQMQPDAAKANSVGHFFTLIVALLGAYR